MTWPGGLVYSHGSEICSASRDIDCCSLGRLTRLNQLEAVPFSSIVDALASSSTVEAAAAAETPAFDCRHRRCPCPHHQCHSRSHYRFRLRHHRRHPRLYDRSLPTPRTGRGPTWHGHHRLHRRLLRPTAATAVTRVAIIAPATILAATSGAAERCDVWEGLSALSSPHSVKNGHVTAISRAQCGVRTSSLVHLSYNNIVTLRSVADWS